MTKVLKGSLVSLGVVVAALAVQQSFNVEPSSAAPRSMMARRSVTAPAGARIDPTHPGYQVAQALGRTYPTSTAVGHQATATPSTSDEPEEPSASTASGWLAWLGLSDASPASPQKAAGAASGVRVSDVPAAAAPAASNSSSNAGTTAHECRSDVEVQAQGVTAAVSFVGIMQSGREMEARQFAGPDVADLKILVQWQNLFSNHAQRIELIAPDGSAYQSLSRGLTARDVDAPVETFVPVGGTWITRYGLYGAWCVDVFFDSDEKPIASTRLVLAPPS